MSLLRVVLTFSLLASLLCVSLAAPERDLHTHGEEGNVLTQMGAVKKEEENVHIPIEEFLEVTDHEHVPRTENESLKNKTKSEQLVVTKSDITKDVMFNKLMENAGRSKKPNKLQGPSLIARYVQGVRDAVGSDSGYALKKEEAKKNEEQMDFMTDFLDMEPLPIVETEATDRSDSVVENVTDLSHLDEMKNNETETLSTEVNSTETVNATETLSTEALGFVTDFLDKDPMDMEGNATETLSTEVNTTETLGVDTLGLDMEAEVNATDTLSSEVNATDDNLDDEVNETEAAINATEPVENPLDFMTSFLDTDPLDMEVNKTEAETTESQVQVDATENQEDAKEEKETTGEENQLDFVTNFLNADPFELMENPAVVSDELVEDSAAISEEVLETDATDKSDSVEVKPSEDTEELLEDTAAVSDESLETEASDRSDSAEVDVEQEENLDFLTDFLSASPAVLPVLETNEDLDADQEENFELLTDMMSVDPANSEISQDILDLYSEDEVKWDEDEVSKRRKPVISNVEFVNAEPVEDNEETSWFSWFGL